MENNQLSCNKIKEVLEALIEEKIMIENELRKNLNQIREIDLYLKSLFEKEDMDYELFSPRNIQSVYKEKIEMQNSTKRDLEDKNKGLYSKINSYERKIENLQDVRDFIEGVNSLSNNGSTIFLEEEKINDTILDIQEKERQRIARDLHDSTVQNLTHLIHKIELASKFTDQDIIRAKMELISVNKNIKSIINDMRNIIFNLRPMEFDDIGITAAFEKLQLELQLKTDMLINFNISNVVLEKELKLISVFHIVQECCNNAIKHSEGTELNVYVQQNQNEIDIVIEDNGIGFDINRQLEDKHFGLTMTKERVSLLYGKMEIQSVLNKGTKVIISIPN